MIKIKPGDKFNRLTAVKFHHKDSYGYYCWVFKCDCGKEVILRTTRVKNDENFSCGCKLNKNRTEKSYLEILEEKSKKSKILMSYYKKIKNGAPIDYGFYSLKSID